MSNSTTNAHLLNRSRYLRHDHLAGLTSPGPFDAYSRDEVLAMLPRLPWWPTVATLQRQRVETVGWVLDWLGSHPGEGWRDRWVAAGMNGDPTGWISAARAGDPRDPANLQARTIAAMQFLVLGKVLLPGYGYFTHVKSAVTFNRVLGLQDPELLTRMRAGAQAARLIERTEHHAMVVLGRVLLHTGRPLELLTADDLLEYRASMIEGGSQRTGGTFGAWALLAAAGVLPAGSSMRAVLRPGQRTPAELVDRYLIRCRPVRDLLVRYIEERKASVDYTTLKDLSGTLAGNFWADLEAHHPGLDSLALTPAMVAGWKERTAVVTLRDGSTRPRGGFADVLLTVRCFYLDLRDWAETDPSLVAWVVRSPITRADIAGSQARRTRSAAHIHQRIRERLPQLSTLVGNLEEQLQQATAILETAKRTPLGGSFTLHGSTYTRTLGRFRRGAAAEGYGVREAETGHGFSAALAEDEAFWMWAVVETLRHTGLRIEELLELTHLALVSYRLPSTGEMVPLLQIVPSKTDEERLLLVSPELASVLATIISRVRRLNGGKVPLIARYDPYEVVTGPPLPHLFQREYGSGPAMLDSSVIRAMFNRSLARMNLVDRVGKPLHFTPHDFRRIFATDNVRDGLPLHIVSRLLGHKHLNSTQVYVAVFEDDLQQTYRAWVDRRRATRPPGEYRKPTDAEWEEFEEHFQLRKVELGSCARPYASSCQHEHACIRCTMLRVDPAQLDRLRLIAANLELRIAEAVEHGWAGEEQQLGISLSAARAKIEASTSSTAQPVALGFPTVWA